MVGGRPRWGVFYALLGSAISLMLFQFTSDKGLVINFLFLFLAGVCSSGPDSIVSGALASEVGERENAQSAVSGIVNGTYSTRHKKCSFPLRISSVNVTNSAVSCGFGHIY